MAVYSTDGWGEAWLIVHGWAMIMYLCGWVARSQFARVWDNKGRSSMHGYNVNIMFIVGVSQPGDW